MSNSFSCLKFFCIVDISSSNPFCISDIYGVDKNYFINSIRCFNSSQAGRIPTIIHDNIQYKPFGWVDVTLESIQWEQSLYLKVFSFDSFCHLSRNRWGKINSQLPGCFLRALNNIGWRNVTRTCVIVISDCIFTLILKHK